MTSYIECRGHFAAGSGLMGGPTVQRFDALDAWRVLSSNHHRSLYVLADQPSGVTRVVFETPRSDQEDEHVDAVSTAMHALIAQAERNHGFYAMAERKDSLEVDVTFTGF